MYTQLPEFKKEESPVTMRQLEEVLARNLAANNIVVKKIIDDKIDSKFGEFALSIKQSFDEVDERFEEMNRKMNQRFDTIDNRLNGIDGQISGLHRRIDDIAINYTRRDEYSKLEKRVTRLETA